MPSDLFTILDAGAVQAVPVIVLEMTGEPRGKGRPRFGRRGNFVAVYTDKATQAYEKGLQAKVPDGWVPLEGPLGVRVFCMMPIPASWSRKKREAALDGKFFPTSKPDADNMLKMLDAFNTRKVRPGKPGFTGLWVDDSQIVRALVIKEYGAVPGIIIEVYRIP